MQLVTETLNWIKLVEELISEVKRLDNKLETLLSRIEGLYNMVRELYRRVNSAVNRMTLVLRLLRKNPNSPHGNTWAPNGNEDRDDTMFWVWIIVHMTEANRLQSRAKHLYRRIEVMVRMLTMAIHRLCKFLYPPYTKWLT